MKIKIGLVILIIFAFVLATCSTWEGDEGVVNIRMVGQNGNSGRSRTIVNPYPDPDSGRGDAYGKPNEKTPDYPQEGTEEFKVFLFKLSDFTYDIYFVKKVYPTKEYDIQSDDNGEETRNPKANNSIPKDNIGCSKGKVEYGKNTTCSLVPGTWILIISAYVTQEDGFRAQGVVYPVEIKPGKNEDIEIEMLYTRAAVLEDESNVPESAYIAPIINERGVILTKGAHF